MMVSLDSARLFYPPEKLLSVDENHSQIAKVKFGESGIYPDICSAISCALSDTPAITKVSAPQKPPTGPQKQPTSPQKQPTCPQKPAISPQEPTTSPQKQPTSPQEPPIRPQKQSTSPQKQTISQQEPPTSPGTMQDVNARSKIDKVSY